MGSRNQTLLSEHSMASPGSEGGPQELLCSCGGRATPRETVCDQKGGQGYGQGARYVYDAI